MAEQVIWKQVVHGQWLDEKNEIVFSLPLRARVLHVGAQRFLGADHDTLAFWFVHSNPGEMEDRRFKVIGTGYAADLSGFIYRGTALLDGGSVVLHLWEFDGGAK